MAGPEQGPADGVPVEVASRPRWLLIALGLVVLFFAVRFLVAEPVLTDGNSMSPTLHDGDALVIQKVSYWFADPEIGEIVVATAPDTGEAVVKRVVAVGGDSIGIEDGVLVRNGVPVAEPYANHDQMSGYFWGPVVVPEGHVFLLGDNRLESHDSRSYGTVSVDAIEGKYLGRFWPL
ncbi:MAG: hypothetical protein RL238_890 [Actinomycetota bacterium]